MSRPEQLRTFVAVYRARSVTDGARLRGLSQPAVSQQLAGLERAVQAPLFVRTARGVEPTDMAVTLYADIAPALDQLESVLSGLESGRPGAAAAAVRFGSTAEFFSGRVLPLLGDAEPSVVARFGDDAFLLGCLERGELDVVALSSVPARRSIASVPIGQKSFALVASPDTAPGEALPSLTELGAWLSGRPWVAFSLDLPITRRFWQVHLGRPFSARLRLVAPDLRAVTGAVERGMGCSILPTFVCAQALADGRVVEVHPVTDLIPREPWFLCFRHGDTVRPQIRQLVRLFDTPRDPDGA
jgi:DNA-binding transcriptional LysR family regulator